MQQATIKFRTIANAPETHYIRDEWNGILQPGEYVLYDIKNDRLFFFNSYAVTYVDEPFKVGFEHPQQSQTEELLLKALAVVANNRKLGE